MGTLEYALRWWDEGLSPFPILAGTKRDTPLKWRENLVSDRQEIIDWWSEFPDDNMGINTGASLLLVVDLDTSAGIEEFQTMWRKRETISYQRYTRVSATASGGQHVWFDLPNPPLPNTYRKLGPHIDTRGLGGMIVAPDSRTAKGEYRLLNSLPVRELPPWLLAKLRHINKHREVKRTRRTGWCCPTETQAAAQLANWCARIIHAPDGEQNNRLNLAAFTLARECCPPLDPEEIREALEHAARTGHHPEHRARPTVASGLAQGLS
jgi:Bifunctional DNA primase/polymerase, N-terminal